MALPAYLVFHLGVVESIDALHFLIVHQQLVLALVEGEVLHLLLDGSTPSLGKHIHKLIDSILSEYLIRITGIS